MSSAIHQATFDIDQPDMPRDRLTVALRVFTVIPAAILLCSLSGGGFFAGSLAVLWIGAFFAVVATWFAIVLTCSCSVLPAGAG
jgi:hypothetical protein